MKVFFLFLFLFVMTDRLHHKNFAFYNFQPVILQRYRFSELRGQKSCLFEGKLTSFRRVHTPFKYPPQPVTRPRIKEGHIMAHGFFLCRHILRKHLGVGQTNCNCFFLTTSLQKKVHFPQTDFLQQFHKDQQKVSFNIFFFECRVLFTLSNRLPSRLPQLQQVRIVIPA